MSQKQSKMTISNLINSIPKPVIYFMGLVVLLNFIWWIIKKIRNKDTDEFTEDPKTDFHQPLIPFEEVNDDKV